MRTLIVGSGPTGLMLGAALARRGHQVISVDRDPVRARTPGADAGSCSSSTPTDSDLRYR